MPSRRSTVRWLFAKEWRELMASRSWWVFLILIGPLVGWSFIDAVRTYAELSGLNGTAVGVGEAFSPLIGVWAPTFSACELAAVFLLPFVVIRLTSGDKQSGALKLESQGPAGPVVRIAIKAVVLMIGWIVATAAPMLAVLLWMFYGGSIHVPELASVLLGHVLNAAIVVGLATAASAIAEHPSTAAIMALGATVGTWILSFTAAVHGGVWEQAARYTPATIVAEMQHGLVRLDVVLVASLLTAALLGVAAIWMRPAVALPARLGEAAALAAIAAGLAWASTLAPGSVDLSEGRRNSFSRADERALRQIDAPLLVEAHLAPEDPRRSDLEHRALSKLRRAMHSVRVTYASSTSIGLFEQSDPHYGEIRFELGERSAVTRATTAEGVLETIYELARITPPPIDDDDVFRGHPLAAPPRGAAVLFYGVWPAAAAAASLAWRRKL